MLPRGIRNHNPLNIRRSKDQWKGQVEREQSQARLNSAEREDGRPKVNGTDSIDWFAMLRGWEMCRDDV